MNQVATGDMMGCIRELLNSSYTGELRRKHYDALVRVLLISVLYQTARHPMDKIIRFTTKEVETMYELKTFCLQIGISP
ncbi:hypothetical protein [Paraflavitalea speifideaquila]|uniref:hypothetical protein n=1 Tax=Paraflavitalea speifideaquila TaxID=3076558 RepID=UPI0028EA7131|nr:hypothetical protein [Paraflavitalea speifideiaquila]